MKILLVDDEKYLLDMMSHFLKKKGHSVEKAANGKEGLEVYKKFPNEFDIIVTDLKMPVMDGMEMLTQISREGFGTPAVVITGHLEMMGSRTMEELNILEIFSKPFILTELDAIFSKLGKS
jgi:CheY-like chemotaxis protein